MEGLLAIRFGQAGTLSATYMTYTHTHTGTVNVVCIMHVEIEFHLFMSPCLNMSVDMLHVHV